MTESQIILGGGVIALAVYLYIVFFHGDSGEGCDRWDD